MLTAILGVAGGVSAALIGAWAALRARRPRKSDLELVDVSVTPERDYVVLDVKVCNRGGQTAVLKRLNLQVLEAERFYGGVILHSALEPSGVYDVVLPGPNQVASAHRDDQTTVMITYASNHGSSVIKDLSHEIPPDNADRFQLRLTAGLGSSDSLVYLLRLDLIYDSGDKLVSSPLLALALGEPFGLGHLEGRLIDLAGIAWRYREPPHDQGPAEWAETLLGQVKPLEEQYSRLVDILARAEVMPPELHSVLDQARADLQELPAIRARFQSSMPQPPP